MLSPFFVDIADIFLEEKLIVYYHSKIFEMTNLLNILPLNADCNEGKHGPCTPFSPTSSQTRLPGLSNVQVYEAAVKTKGQSVIELATGGAVGTRQTGHQGHVISIVKEGEVTAVALYFIYVYGKEQRR